MTAQENTGSSTFRPDSSPAVRMRPVMCGWKSGMLLASQKRSYDAMLADKPRSRMPPSSRGESASNDYVEALTIYAGQFA